LTYLNKEENDPLYLSYQFIYSYLVWQGLPIMVEGCIACKEPFEKETKGYSLCYERAGMLCPDCAKQLSVFNPVPTQLILILQEFVKSNPFMERKRMDDFFQNCEDLDRIVKEYYHFLFGKKLVTYNSLKKL
jgi:recombinational DNA repair protein (RecF pathway)